MHIGWVGNWQLSVQSGPQAWGFGGIGWQRISAAVALPLPVTSSFPTLAQGKSGGHREKWQWQMLFPCKNREKHQRWVFSTGTSGEKQKWHVGPTTLLPTHQPTSDQKWVNLSHSLKTSLTTSVAYEIYYMARKSRIREGISLYA